MHRGVLRNRKSEGGRYIVWCEMVERERGWREKEGGGERGGTDAEEAAHQAEDSKSENAEPDIKTPANPINLKNSHVGLEERWK